MGVYLTEILSADFHDITVTSRSSRKSSGVVTYVQGDAKSRSFLESLLQSQWDAVVDFMVYTTAEFKDRVDLLLSSTAQYFYLSSARVYAGSEKPLTESSPRLLDVSKDEAYLATDEYALAKARQENILFQNETQNWTIIRPYITYGPERLQLGVFEKEAWLYRALQGRTVIFNSDLCSRLTTMTSGRDVARGIAALIGDARALGQAFHITNNHPVAWQQVLDLYKAKLCDFGRDFAVKLVDLETFIGCHGGRYQIIYDRMYNHTFNNGKIDQFVDTGSFCLLEEGLGSCIESFLKNPKFSEINWPSEGSKDRVSGQIAKLGEINRAALFLRYVKKRLGL